MAARYGARRYSLFCVLIISAAGLLAARIALGTPYNVHPDEFIHVDAFCYFEAHAWLPPLNLNGLNYGPEGASRVYESEIVYWVFGRSAAGVDWVRGLGAAPPAPAPAPPASNLSPRQFLPMAISAAIIIGPEQAQCIAGRYFDFRLFNTALLIITLVILFGVGVKHAWAAAIGMALVCLPQVVYIYGYANSDGWALSFAIFLLVFAMAERHPLRSLRTGALLGLLTGIVLLSKQSVWPALPFAYALVGYRAVQDWRAAKAAWLRAPGRPGALAAAVALIVIMPMRVWYPLSQGGHLADQLAQIREDRASPGFKPSDPYAPGRQLRTKGIGLDQVVFNRYWMETSADSFYGRFGYQYYPAPAAAYGLALALAVLNGLLSVRVMRRHWQNLPDELRLGLMAAPCLLVVCVGASLYNSWTHDFQPQGRYILLAVVPVALWMWGTLPWESPRLRALRLISAAVLLVLCAYVLRHVVFLYPAFQL